MAKDINFEDSIIIFADFENDLLKRTYGSDDLLVKVKQLLEKSREADMLIAYTRVCFQEDYKDAPLNHPLFQNIKKNNIIREKEVGSMIHESLKPTEDEHVFKKNCVNPFVCSDLKAYLEDHDIKNIFIAGIFTNFVVESIARHAADLNYKVYVIEDCCSSDSKENHDFTVKNILPKVAKVISFEEFSEQIEKCLQHQDDLVDEAVDESFPASDPISPNIFT